MKASIRPAAPPIATARAAGRYGIAAIRLVSGAKPPVIELRFSAAARAAATPSAIRAALAAVLAQAGLSPTPTRLRAAAFAARALAQAHFRPTRLRSIAARIAASAGVAAVPDDLTPGEISVLISAVAAPRLLAAQRLRAAPASAQATAAPAAQPTRLRSATLAIAAAAHVSATVDGLADIAAAIRAAALKSAQATRLRSILATVSAVADTVASSSRIRAADATTQAASSSAATPSRRRAVQAIAAGLLSMTAMPSRIRSAQAFAQLEADMAAAPSALRAAVATVSAAGTVVATPDTGAPSYLVLDRLDHPAEPDPNPYTQVGSQAITWGVTPGLGGNARSVLVESGEFGTAEGMWRQYLDTPLAEFGFYIHGKITASVTANAQLLMLTQGSADTRVISLQINSSQHIGFGSINAISSYFDLGLSVGDEFHFWADYSDSNNANNVDFYVAIGPTPTKPGTPTHTMSTGNRQCGAIHYTSARRPDPIWANAILHDSFIGSNPLG